MGASALALPALEVAVARGRAALARLEPVGVHGQAHAATRLAPLEARLDEDPIEALGLGLAFDQPAAGHDHGADAVGDLVAPNDGGRGSQVLDPAVRAGADEDAIDADRRDRRARLQAHVLQGAGGRLAVGLVREIGRIGNLAGHVDRPGRDWFPT